MTNQERPVEEHKELLNDLLNTTQVAVEEQIPSLQQEDVAETQAEPEERPEAALNAETEHTNSDSETEAHADVPEAVAQADEADTATSKEAEAETDATEQARAVGADAPLALTTPSLDETPASEQATDTADMPSATEGASYTPVDEDTSGRPRRVKDLEPGMELEGRVTSIALYGIFVDIGVGRDGLVHISEMSDTRIDSPSDVVQIGDVVKVRVKSVEPDGKRISLTMRTRDRNEARSSGAGRGRKKPELNREALANLRVGDTVEGTVTGIAPFGVFVDIGVGKDGLVHISELSEGRIDKAEDAVQVGQTYMFKLLEVDAEGTRISLSLRRAQRAQRMQQLEPGQIMDGTISGLAPFGAFVDIGVGRDGLVHISELSQDRVSKVEDVVKVGDPVRVRVLGVDPQSKRISLTMRLEDRPREEPVASRSAPPSTTPAAQEEPRGRREEPRGRREERNERPQRNAPQGPTSQDQSVESRSNTEDSDEETTNATLEDLLSKYGNGSRRDRRRRRDDDEDEGESGGERSGLRRQRDAIRRTIQQMHDEE